MESAFGILYGEADGMNARVENRSTKAKPEPGEYPAEFEADAAAIAVSIDHNCTNIFRHPRRYHVETKAFVTADKRVQRPPWLKIDTSKPKTRTLISPHQTDHRV